MPSSRCSGLRPSRSSTAWPGRTPSSPAAPSTPRPTASIWGGPAPSPESQRSPPCRSRRTDRSSGSATSQRSNAATRIRRLSSCGRTASRRLASAFPCRMAPTSSRSEKTSKAAMNAVISELPVGIEITQIADQPHIVNESVSEFVETFAEALVIVLVVSFLSLGWRTGIVVALSVPLVLAIVLLVMYATGLDLHRITLGLLVDDAIIAIEMMVVKMEQGWDRARAATFAWTSTAFPMLTGTLVTAAGFLPVGFAKSSAGEYAGGIFWIVSIALIASWIV